MPEDVMDATPEPEPQAEGVEPQGGDTPADNVFHEPYDALEDAPTEEPAEEAEEESAAEEPQFDDQLVRVAAQYGITDLSRFKNGDQLEAYLMALDDFRQSQSRQTTDRQPQQPKASERFKLELPEEIDPGISKAFQSLYDENKSVIERLGQFETFFESMSQSAAHYERSQFEEQFDNFINNLPEEYAGLFGKGRGADLKSKAADRGLFQNRKKVHDYAWQLQDMARRSNQNWTMEDIFNRAVHGEFPQKQQELARKKLQAQVKKRSEQVSPKPTQRRPAQTLSEEQEIIKGIREDKKRLGIGISEDEMVA